MRKRTAECEPDEKKKTWPTKAYANTQIAEIRMSNPEMFFRIRLQVHAYFAPVSSAQISIKTHPPAALNAFTTGNPFLGTNLLGVSIWEGFWAS